MPESKGQSGTNEESDGKLALRLLALGKKSGLSFAEINELRATDLLDLARFYAGTDDDKPKEASQDDIDAFYGR